MKEKLNKIINIFAIFALVLSSGSLAFISGNETQVKLGSKEEVNAQQTYSISIKVLNESPKNTFLAVDEPKTVISNTDCRSKPVLKSEKNYFQDQGSVDLNQPAGCFSLGLGTVKNIVTSLEVKILNRPSTRVVVIELPNQIFATVYENMPFSDNDSKLAVSGSGVFGIVLGKNLFKQVSVKQSIQNRFLSSQKTLEELQNFRC